MITLPNTLRNRATFRILTMPEGSWESQEWTALPVPLILQRGTTSAISGTVTEGGYHVESITRWCLPDEDRAAFYIDTGTINGVEVEPEDLSNKVVRIQVMDDETFPNGASSLPSDGWKTVFIGSVISVQHKHQTGLDLFGRVTYYCAGVLWRTRMWALDRHSTESANHCKGHPGYNIPLHGFFRKVLGNRDIVEANDPFGDMGDISTYYLCHKLPLDGNEGATQKWTDVQVVRHAVSSSRAKSEPIIYVDFSRGNFDGSYAWDVSAGDTCWDILRRICNRQRGRGSVFMNYDDIGGSSGEVQLTLIAYPASGRAVTYFTPSYPGELAMSQLVTIPGAQVGVTAIDVDINGDHRVTNDGFKYEDRYSSVYDAVTVQGEKIQVCCNLNFFGSSLQEGWSPEDLAAFAAIPAGQTVQASSARWRHVCRRFRMLKWATTVTSEPGGTAHSINYYCDKNGAVRASTTGTSVDGSPLSSDMSLRILPDLPIYEGWRYDGNEPARYDGAQDYLPPGRMTPFVFYKTADDGPETGWTWFPLDRAGFNIQSDDFGMLIHNSAEDQSGVRFLCTREMLPNWFAPLEMLPNVKGVTTLSGFDYNLLNTTVGMELGTRVSITNYASEVTDAPFTEAGKRLLMTVNGVHLWLAPPDTIWEFDTTRAGQSGWTPGLKIPNINEGIAYILRDDRAELSFISALAWDYWGWVHNPGTWSLMDCGFMTSFTANDSTIDYPTLGQIIGTVTYAGQIGSEYKITLDTPVTCIHYDHEQGVTTWRTDYVSYNGSIQ